MWDVDLGEEDAVVTVLSGDDRSCEFLAGGSHGDLGRGIDRGGQTLHDEWRHGGWIRFPVGNEGGGKSKPKLRVWL